VLSLLSPVFDSLRFALAQAADRQAEEASPSSFLTHISLFVFGRASKAEEDVTSEVDDQHHGRLPGQAQDGKVQ